MKKGLILILLLSFVCFSKAATNEVILNALTDLYNATQGNNWLDHENWTDPNVPFCQWYGIFCDPQAQTMAIKLIQNNLIGTIPSSLANIGTNLTVLLLNENTLSGTIPPALATEFTNMSLFDVSQNTMTGTVPIGFGNYSKLVQFWIATNEFYGNVPWDLEYILPQVVKNQPSLGCRMGGLNFCCPLPPWVPVECSAGCNITEICTESPHISI